MRHHFHGSARRLWPWFLTAIISAASVQAPASAAHAAAGVSFLSHQALYNLSLVKSRGSTSLDSARGRIFYRFSGNVCEGYTSDFRQVSEMNNGEGKTTLSDMQSTSWEDAEGKTYRFKIMTRMDESGQSEVDGVAERNGDKITVKLKRPVAKTFTVDGKAVFPTEQIRRIIAAAKEGKSLLELTVYDGSDNGQKVYNTFSVIGKPIRGEGTASSSDPSTANNQMKALTRWPVTVSYYERDAAHTNGEQTPNYAMSFELFEDGVSRALVLDYNDFVISGKMDKFDISDVRSAKPCK
ncbi:MULTISPECIES: cell envelope integrity EipB family protein [unclassified Nitrobacter]|uniref:cell envelope integrity EipB family protein n=1 Tax=unclassified Nitrobacter TaxID=2620411 RepID=UPI000594C7A8|nr:MULTISPECIES: cell envelope integrity EipB family protein [unclassified Nitrobacter]MCB1394029.1 cell envelope integrity EipB family protein [Nitrobacter sp.]MCV0387658.1 cell envelope integrity EipB family protein [Nitrobacter sp.]